MCLREAVSSGSFSFAILTTPLGTYHLMYFSEVYHMLYLSSFILSFLLGCFFLNWFVRVYYIFLKQVVVCIKKIVRELQKDLSDSGGMWLHFKWESRCQKTVVYPGHKRWRLRFIWFWRKYIYISRLIMRIQNYFHSRSPRKKAIFFFFFSLIIF